MNQKQDQETLDSPWPPEEQPRSSLPSSQHKLFPCEIKAPTPTPGPGSQEDPRCKPRVTQAVMLSDSKRDLDTKKAGGLGGTEQKEKSGLPRPSYPGSLNSFQIKTNGLPWTHSRRGCFPGNLPAPHHRMDGKSMQQRPAASPAPSAGGFPYIPSTSKPWQPLSGDQGHHPPTRTTPQKKAGPRVRQQQTRREQDSYKPPAQPLSFVGPRGLGFRQAAAPRTPPAYIRLSSLPNWPVHSSKSKASLCQS